MDKGERADADIALLTRVFEAINEGGIDAAIEFADPEIEFLDTGLITPRVEVRGRDELVRHMHLYESNFAGLHYAPLEFLRRGPAIVVPNHVTGRGQSGNKFELLLASAFWVREERVVRAGIYKTREEALRLLS